MSGEQREFDRWYDKYVEICEGHEMLPLDQALLGDDFENGLTPFQAWMEDVYAA